MPVKKPRLQPDEIAWMRRALRAARGASRRGEVPVGALVVRDGVVLGSGSNRTLADRDPSAHAEIVALRRAARAAGNHRLTGAEIYVTLEPCPMCLGALIQARVARIVYGAADPKAGAAWLLDEPEFRARANHRPGIAGGILGDEAGALLREFFRARRGSTRRAPDPRRRG